jgi:hypothetical protein
VGRVWGGQRTVAVIDVIDTGRRGGFDPAVVDATTFPITIEDEASTGESTMRMVDRRAAHDGGNRRPAHRTLPWGREDVWHTNVDVVRRGRCARDVCTYNGKHSRWCQAALRQKAGRVTAAGITQDVSCEPVNGAIDVAILFRTHGDKNRPETSTR